MKIEIKPKTVTLSNNDSKILIGNDYFPTNIYMTEEDDWFTRKFISKIKSSFKRIQKLFKTPHTILLKPVLY